MNEDNLSFFYLVERRGGNEMLYTFFIDWSNVLKKFFK